MNTKDMKKNEQTAKQNKDLTVKTSVKAGDWVGDYSTWLGNKFSDLLS
ncbi:MAG: hypothetical protein ACPG7F_11490 [Aggregatilineales bacterium]